MRSDSRNPGLLCGRGGPDRKVGWHGGVRIPRSPVRGGRSAPARQARALLPCRLLQRQGRGCAEGLRLGAGGRGLAQALRTRSKPGPIQPSPAAQSRRLPLLSADGGHMCCTAAGAGTGNMWLRLLPCAPQVVLAPLGLPAGNRWTKLWPVVGQIAVQLGFFSLVADALASESSAGRGSGAVASASGNGLEGQGAEEAAVGLAPEDAETMRQLAGRQCRRAKEFYAAPESRRRAVLWSIIGKSCMVIHYRLFAFGTWLSHNKDIRGRSSLLEFCDSARSPAAAELKDLAELLDSEHPRWSPLWATMCGPWSPELFGEAQAAVVSTLCEVWRRLWRAFRRWPWRLAAVCEPARSDEAEGAAEDFLQASDCCLDAGFGKRLREAIGESGVGGLQDALLQDFMLSMFSRCVVTSTYVERVFAGLSQATRSANMDMPALQARHVLQTFDSQVQRWRASAVRAGGRRKGVSATGRPAWMKPTATGSRINGLQLWQRQYLANHAAGASGATRLAESRAAWKALAQEERRTWQQRAISERALNRQRASPLEAALADAQQPAETGGGPWGTYAATGWPLSRDTLAAALEVTTCRRLAERWCEDGGRGGSWEVWGSPCLGKALGTWGGLAADLGGMQTQLKRHRWGRGRSPPPGLPRRGAARALLPQARAGHRGAVL